MTIEIEPRDDGVFVRGLSADDVRRRLTRREPGRRPLPPIPAADIEAAVAKLKAWGMPTDDEFVADELGVTRNRLAASLKAHGRTLGNISQKAGA